MYPEEGGGGECTWRRGMYLEEGGGGGVPDFGAAAHPGVEQAKAHLAVVVPTPRRPHAPPLTPPAILL